MLSVSEAIREVLAAAAAGPAETVALADCLGRTLAVPLLTPQDSPLFDKALMDGFAVGSRQLADRSQGSTAVDETLLSLRVLETVTAGTIPTQTVVPGTAVRIMTGAALPPGADCVVPVERTVWDESQPETVRIRAAELMAESCVLRRGAAATAGQLLLAAGTRIAAQQLAALAEFGICQVSVYRQPRVAILATGDELVPAHVTPGPGQIRNSNAPMLVAQVQQAAAQPFPLGIARDTADDLQRQIQRGLQYDVLLLTGGVSAGTLDLVPAQLRAAGVRPVFHGIHMKPGKPLWFGVSESGEQRCLVFGLPGNPVSSLVCFELFVRTALRRLLGAEQAAPVPLTARLTESVAVRGDRPVYFPARLRLTDLGLQASPVPWSGSSDLRATVEANGMLLLRPEDGPRAAESLVQVLPWSNNPFV